MPKRDDVEHAMLDIVFHHKSIRCSCDLFLTLVFSSNFKGVSAVNQKIGFCCGLHLMVYLQLVEEESFTDIAYFGLRGQGIGKVGVLQIDFVHFAHTSNAFRGSV